MSETFLVDVAGWLGVAALLAAYGLVSAKRLEGNSVLYQGLNVLGAGLLIVNSFYYGAYPSVAINLIWIGIGVYTLWYVSRKKPS
jgi:hypothetical protein